MARVSVYNAEVGQTDSTPCVAGGTGFNICEMHAQGKRLCALSQDMIAWTGRGKYKAGDVIMLEHEDPFVNGECIVADAMNVRYTNSVDIFHPTRRHGVWQNYGEPTDWNVKLYSR